jgi:uncharacterized protein (DUF433 family)
LPLDLDIFGQGIYSPREAAHLIGGTPQEVLRWTRGSGPTPPLWKSHYQSLEDTTEISFADLIEVRLVRAFRAAGISLQAIRFAIEFAREKYSSDHPLSSLGFKTDGGEILMEATERDGEMVSLSKKRPGQKVFTRIIEQSLSDLEYGDEKILAWRPKVAKHVIIDPQRSFGTPIIDEFGVSTQMIFEQTSNGMTPKYLAKLYEIPVSLISDAIKYEKFLFTQQQKNNGQSSI